MNSKSGKNYLLFVFGVILIVIPIISKINLEFGDLQSAPDGNRAKHEIRSSSYVVAFRDINRSKLTPHILEYELFINLKNDSNPFDLKKGSLKIDASFNCSNKKHFFKLINYSKYNNFSNFGNDALGNLIPKWKEFESLYTDYASKSKFKEVFNEACPILLFLDYFYTFNRTGDVSETVKSPNAKIGIALDFEQDEPKIIDVIKDSPADKSGLKIGDSIIEIDEVSIDKFGFDLNKRNEEIIQKLRGMPDTKVILKIRKNNSNEIALIPVLREEQEIDTIKIHIKNDLSKPSDLSPSLVSIKCKQETSWPNPINLINRPNSLFLRVSNEFNKVGLIEGKNIYDFPNDDWNLQSNYYASTKFSIPVCQVISLPKNLENKNFILIREFKFKIQY